MLRQSAKEYGIVLLAIVGVWFFLRHDAFLYQGPVGQVTQMTEKVTQATTDEHNNSDTMMTQHLTVEILNRNQTIKLTNTYADSQVITNRYRVGDQLLLENVGGNIHILSLKRDALIGALGTLFIGLLVIYSRWRATSWLLLSLVLNVVLFGVAIHVDIHDKNANVLLVFSVLALGLAIASLALVLGKTLQMTLTLLATVVTTGLTMLILFAVLAVTHGKGVHFETMSYVTQLPKSIFMAQTVIGVLGAVMDE
ncbi:YibE/F family protein, partial [Leuconostoc sp.]